MSKLDKLSELNELFKMEAISKEEFETLKKEIINGESPKVEDKKTDTNTFVKDENKTEKNITENTRDKERVILKSFSDSDGKRIKAPEIEYLNLKDITKGELNLLKSFIRLKQIHAPSEMSEDEIKLGNKIFTALEIATMNSERSGFNYAFGSIISVLCAGVALYFILLSPCFILLGAGTGLVSSTFVSISTLNKVDATKLDRNFSYAALVLVVISILAYAKGWSII